MKTELYNDTTSSWSVLADYPYSYSTYLSGHATVYHESAFYIFGGAYNENTIAKLDEVSETWSRVGYLKANERPGSSVIHDGTVFLVVGGDR